MPPAGTTLTTASPPSRSSAASNVATPCADFSVRTRRKRSAMSAGTKLAASSGVPGDATAPPSPARCAGKATRSLVTLGLPLAETASGLLGGWRCHLVMLLVSTVEARSPLHHQFACFVAYECDYSQNDCDEAGQISRMALGQPPSGLVKKSETACRNASHPCR